MTETVDQDAPVIAWVFEAAGQAAWRRRRRQRGTVDLLLGLLRTEEGIASQALSTLDITYRSVLKMTKKGGDTLLPRRKPREFTPGAKVAIGNARRFAERLKDKELRSEHLLSALLEDNEVLQVLKVLRVDLEVLRHNLHLRSYIERFSDAQVHLQRGFDGFEGAASLLDCWDPAHAEHLRNLMQRLQRSLELLSKL